MNRRQFFATLGIPALALPVVRLLNLPKDDIFSHQVHNRLQSATTGQILMVSTMGKLTWSNIHVGMVAFNTDDGVYYRYDGKKWVRWLSTKL